MLRSLVGSEMCIRDSRNVLVTGGNAGIGLALCKQLAVDHNCFVFMCSRSVDRGQLALRSILDEHSEAKDRIELLQLDVADDASVAAAATALKERNVTLYAVVNNAGIGLNTGCDAEVLNTNLLGPKRVSEAMVGLVDPTQGRIVNVSSGSASMWLRDQDDVTKALFTSPETSWDELVAAAEAGPPHPVMGMYGVSKAALTAYTIQQARAWPHLVCTSLSPGFIQTNMTEGFGARLTPEEGTVSLLRCLLGDVVSGRYYGSDGLRSPLTCTRAVSYTHLTLPTKRIV
eukprot:TRINITY_DN24264_c0_g1_i1.p1 TRINITY_DN24264_c0_g1~~TRINITY_DN24264_c0_g1_i1.p1  ORF type:complete len:287 (-),score=82.95 TRINITY_DN24264_c0_g1_i1:154-1014(-)